MRKRPREVYEPIRPEDQGIYKVPRLLPPSSVEGGLINNCIVTSPADGDVLTFKGTTATWINKPVNSFTGVTTDSSLQGNGLPASPLGVAVQAGVAPGTYVAATVTINNRGIVTAIAASGALITVSTTAALTGNGTSGSPLDLATQGGFTPGTFAAATVTVNSKGIITAIVASGALTAVTTTSAFSGSGTGASPLDLATQGGLTPGSYTNCNLTVNSKGIITVIANGSAGGVTSVVAGSGISVTGTASVPVINLATVGSAATSWLTGLTINTFGQITGLLDPVAAFTVQWKQLQNIANFSVVTILANNLQTYVNKTTPSVSTFATGTGVYTCQKAGSYVGSVFGSFPAAAGGTQRTVFVVQTASVGTVTLGEMQSTFISGSIATQCVCSFTTFMAVGDTLFFDAFQDSGATLNGCTFICSIALTNASP